MAPKTFFFWHINYPDSHHSKGGPWDLPHKFHLYLINWSVFARWFFNRTLSIYFRLSGFRSKGRFASQFFHVKGLVNFSPNVPSLAECHLGCFVLAERQTFGIDHDLMNLTFWTKNRDFEKCCWSWYLLIHLLTVNKSITTQRKLRTILVIYNL